MTKKVTSVLVFATLLAVCIACAKKSASQELEVQIPAGFNGNFVLDMGVHDSAPLPRQGTTYTLTLPQDGKIQTSTLLENPHVTFKNAGNGKVWGYTQRTFTTGDGISIGGKIEFFVGSQKDFEAEQNKKNKSGGFFKPEQNSVGV